LRKKQKLTINSIECAKKKIRKIIESSSVPEDPLHAENTLKWLLKLESKAGQALQIAALAHDIERAIEDKKVSRIKYKDFDAFKEAHARNGAKILRYILEKCEVDESITNEACRLVTLHEVGGDAGSDLLKDADSISFFDVNLTHYYKREGWEEARRRAIWGYRRISKQKQKILSSITYEDDQLKQLLKDVIQEATYHYKINNMSTNL
jgi:hypothetical protein